MMNFKMIEKPLVMLFLLCLLPLGASAQSKVKGVVKDSSGEPIIGATIKVNGSKVGAVTDLDGNFSIDAAPGSTLTITYVGEVVYCLSREWRLGLTLHFLGMVV